MKKYYFLLLSAFILFSCSDDATEQNTTDPTLLQRIDFYPGTVNERRWFFNADGILNEITKADGTVVQNFSYDTSNRLTNSTLFSSNGTSQNYTFTYDNNGFVSSVNGQIVNYDSAQAAYYTGDLTQSYRLTQINSDKLLVYGKTAYHDFDENGDSFEIVWDEIMVGYDTNSNLTGYFLNDSCHSSTYDNFSNPLRNATLAICRAFSFIENSQWVDGLYNSVNNPLSQNYCSEDPESETYSYTFNANNLPVTQTRNDYYFGVFENTFTSAKYYYQGDVLP